MADNDDNIDLYEEMSALEQAMASEETAEEGTFLTGGNLRDGLDFELSDEMEMTDEIVLNPAPVRDGPELLDFLRTNLHKFDSPYAYIGGEANSPERDRIHDAELKILIARLSTYESVSLSMSHSFLLATYADTHYEAKSRAGNFVLEQKLGRENG